MKELKLYQCEVCGTQYSEKQKARDCEASHKIPVKVSGTKYRSQKSNQSGYPDYVTVSFEDGSTRKYKLD